MLPPGELKLTTAPVDVIELTDISTGGLQEGVAITLTLSTQRNAWSAAENPWKPI